jgi:hypothetical protein
MSVSWLRMKSLISCFFRLLVMDLPCPVTPDIDFGRSNCDTDADDAVIITAIWYFCITFAVLLQCHIFLYGCMRLTWAHLHSHHDVSSDSRISLLVIWPLGAILGKSNRRYARGYMIVCNHLRILILTCCFGPSLHILTGSVLRCSLGSSPS